MKKITAIVLLAAIALIFASFLTGCSSFTKQQRKAQAFYNEYPNELAKLCADKFPVTERVIKGKDSIRRDTVDKVIWVKCPPNGKDTIQIPVPLTKTITNTITRVDSVVKENTAQVSVYRQQNIDLGEKNQLLTQSLADAKVRINHLILALVGVAVLAASAIFYSIRKMLAK